MRTRNSIFDLTDRGKRARHCVSVYPAESARIFGKTMRTYLNSQYVWRQWFTFHTRSPGDRVGTCQCLPPLTATEWNKFTFLARDWVVVASPERVWCQCTTGQNKNGGMDEWKLSIDKFERSPASMNDCLIIWQSVYSNWILGFFFGTHISFATHWRRCERHIAINNTVERWEDVRSPPSNDKSSEYFELAVSRNWLVGSCWCQRDCERFGGQVKS